LNDLAFSGRNKDYGSFILRRNIRGFFSFPSFLLSVVAFNDFDSIGYLLFPGPELDISMDALVSVEYTFIPSPEEDLSSLAKALARPQAPPEEEVPQIVDTTIPEKKNVPEEIKKVENTDVKNDSAGSSYGQSPKVQDLPKQQGYIPRWMPIQDSGWTPGIPFFSEGKYQIPVVSLNQVFR